MAHNSRLLGSYFNLITGVFKKRLTVNRNSGIQSPIGDSLLHLIGADAITPRTTIDAFASAPALHFRRANGTLASKSALALNDQILGFSAFGFGSTVYSGSNRGGITVVAAEAWTDTAQGTNFFIQTTKKGTAGTVDSFLIDSEGNVVPNVAAGLATTATDGFTYMQTCAGIPTGVPTAYTGRAAFVYDDTNNNLYIRKSDGTWRAHSQDNAYDPQTTIIEDGRFMIFANRLNLSGSERMTCLGNSRLMVI